MEDLSPRNLPEGNITKNIIQNGLDNKDEISTVISIPIRIIKDPSPTRATIKLPPPVSSSIQEKEPLSESISTSRPLNIPVIKKIDEEKDVEEDRETVELEEVYREDIVEDEVDENLAHRLGFIKTDHAKGLRNLGNTCFMNSTIQCLAHSTQLLELIQKNYFTNSEENSDLTDSFADVIRDLWSLGGKNSTRATVDPVKFKGEIGKFAPKFSGYNQHDSQDRIEKNCGTEDNSFVTDLFMGQFRSTLKCLKCNNESVTFEPFWVVSLPIPPKSVQPKLEDYSYIYFTEEILDGDEKATCEKVCKSRQKCSKWYTFERWPQIFVVHFKRFESSRFRSKISHHIDVPLTSMNVGEFSSKPGNQFVSYDCFGISNHSGSLGGGHYTAYGRHPIYHSRWHLYNDSFVSKAGGHNVVSNEAITGMSDPKDKVIENDVEQLLSHWVKKKIRIQGTRESYYYNTLNKISVWNLEDLIKEEKLLEKQEAQIKRCLQKKNIKIKLENAKKNLPYPKKTASSISSLEKRPDSPKTIIYGPKKPHQVELSPKEKKANEGSQKKNLNATKITTSKNEDESVMEEDELELMEVDEVDPGILEELRDLRREESISTPPPISEEFKLSNSDGGHKSCSTVVIDTNIFLSHLSSIDKIIEMGHTVHVPWAVFREWDLLKDSKRSVHNGHTNISEKLTFRARKAIDFLHNALSSENSKIYGQNGEEELEASLLFRGDNADDKILQYCLYLKKSKTNTTTESFFNLLLYSNDKNLLNKALLNKLKVASSSSLLQCLRKNFDAMRENDNSTSFNKRISSTSPSHCTPYDLKKDIIDEARDLCFILLTDSLKLELMHLYGTFKWKSKLEPSVSSIVNWSLCEAFKQVMNNWEDVYSPIVGCESNDLRKDLKVVESILARPRPLNKVWNLIDECLKTLNMLNSCLSSSRPSYYSSCGRAVQIRIELLLKRKVGIEDNINLEFLGGNIYESFNSIWNYIYAYVTSYSVSLGVPLSKSIPTPKQSKELASKLEKLLRVSSEELSTSSPPLLSLMNHMHRFIYDCSSFRPGGHPSADPLPKLVPRALLQYSVNLETRQCMIIGFNQLHDLIRQFEACCSKI
ncbi:USP2 [Lepeophtheirus salmonis]|uniref:ubiquitinyl hydrolase 1 n=2 Tax=Lepeophtheirus salmonis TaxID=72036 RepID=A0A7R8HDY7_LEPSM|nr:USP2 [Lepeophtheirus salmonis]CAF3038446.1 USP2 [Lepeophtheirus salmonis]